MVGFHVSLPFTGSVILYLVLGKDSALTTRPVAVHSGDVLYRLMRVGWGGLQRLPGGRRMGHAVD